MRAMSAAGRRGRASATICAGFLDEGHIRLPLQHEGQGLPERQVVVDQQDPDRWAGSDSKASLEPPPGRGSTVC
jgi:hypothetical protein